MNKRELLECVCKLERPDPLRRKALADYSEEELRRLLDSEAKLHMELLERQCVSMLC